jgi:hypothetical protein
MRYTLLEMTQAILSAMDSDEVNSINDTVESYQVALLLKGVYYDIATDIGLPQKEGIFQLEEFDGAMDPDKPTVMTMPTAVTKVNWVKYNQYNPDEDDESDYKDVFYMPFKEFHERMNGYANSGDSAIGQMLIQNDEDDYFEIIYRTDSAPTWYTSIGQNTVIFDSFDSSIEDTLQSSNTMLGGLRYPEFTLADDFEPDFDPTEFSYYLNKAKVRAFAELKQAQNQEAAGEARRQKIIVQKRKDKIPNVPTLWRLPRYGRK